MNFPTQTDRAGPYALVTIARTGGRFRGFDPYVASISDRGVVAFQAALSGGGEGIFRSDGGRIVEVISSTAGPFRRFYSHPDINRRGWVSLYGEFEDGRQAVVSVQEGGRLHILAESGERFSRIGPLGPTMNEQGRVAFRGRERSGEQGVYVAGGSALRSIAGSSGLWQAFHGLPLIDEEDRVVFRADLAGGGQGIYRGDGRMVTAIVQPDGRLQALGAFPASRNDGAVAFVATLESGAAAIFVAHEGRVRPLIDARAAFESLRGVLVDGAGNVIFYATPPAGVLGMYAWSQAGAEPILAPGDILFGSVVAGFALNPVSINEAGQLAIRVWFEDGEQAILRGDRIA